MAYNEEEQQGFQGGGGNQIFYDNNNQRFYRGDEIVMQAADITSLVPGPIGLTLSKTSSLVDLLAAVSQGNSTAVASAQPDYHGSGFQSTTSQKLKASNFAIRALKIGDWQKETIYQGDLTAKLYYAKRKLVWEILDRPLKRKMEIQWSDIIAIKAILLPNEPGMLAIELNQPPTFGQEINPQPRKHTVWQASSDFTNGRAINYRRHYVSFAPGILDKHYEQLLQSDERLLELSQKPFPSQPHELFLNHTPVFGFSQPTFRLNGYGSAGRVMQPRMCFPYQQPCTPAPTRGEDPFQLSPSAPISGMHYSYGNDQFMNPKNRDFMINQRNRDFMINQRNRDYMINQRNQQPQQQTIWNHHQGINNTATATTRIQEPFPQTSLTQGHNQATFNNPQNYVSNENLFKIDECLQEDTHIDEATGLYPLPQQLDHHHQYSMSTFANPNISTPYNNNHSQMDSNYQMAGTMCNQVMQTNQVSTYSWPPPSTMAPVDNQVLPGLPDLPGNNDLDIADYLFGP